MSATVTAIDREAGTITVESLHPFVSAFSQILKEYYTGDAIADLTQWGSPIFGAVRSADVSRLAGCRVSRPGELSPAAMVALTTFCALEWLRHRKAEVRAAEESGDYTTLIAEFVTWLRALLAAWQGKIGTMQADRERRGE